MTFDLEKMIGQAKTVGIAGHIRPDGDAVGSCLGLGLYMEEHHPEIQTKVFLQDFQDCFLFLKGADKVCRDPEEGMNLDLFFCLDCGEAARLGEFAPCFESASKTVCIDHHKTNRSFADVNMIDPDASSTSELIFRAAGEDKISFHMAEALFMGIIHDTGVFQYSCTSGDTLRAAGCLKDKGINTDRIIEDTYVTKTYPQKQILGKALLESILLMDGKIIFSSLTQKDLEFYNIVPKDLDGIVSVLRSTEGVDAAIFIYETAPLEWKVSLRSSDQVDVSTVAACFGGGGHAKAAGCSMIGTADEIVKQLTDRIRQQLEKE